jgi:hypothetical protein
MDKILVFGDEVVDWIDIPTKPQLEVISVSGLNNSNWRLTPGTHRIPVGGGTYLIVDLLKEIFPEPENVTGPEFIKDKIPGRETCIQSYMRVEEYDAEEKKEKWKREKKVWRVKEFLGYDGPLRPQHSKIIINGKDHFKTVIIDDAANGIRNSVGSFNLISTINPPDTIIYKLARPLNAGTNLENTPGLWETVTQKKAQNNFELIVLLDVNDLRNEGAAISHGLSWERFASDVVHFFSNNTHIKRFNEDVFEGWIVVKAGLEGAVILPPGFKTEKNKDGESPILIYNPEKGEDDWFDEFRGTGKMTGFFSVFTAAIGATLNSTQNFSKERLIHAVKNGLFSSVELFKSGFIINVNNSSVNYPLKQIGELIKDCSADNFQHIEIPLIPSNYSITKEIWKIAETFKLKGIVEIAEKLVRQENKKVNIPIPCAKFGKFITYDPLEIESFRTVKRLVREYLEAGVSNSPLCLGVFGKPGSGKSFGVREVVGSLLPKNTPVWTFNLSEFQTVSELSRAFHIVHDLTRDGTMPLIFFDEFDCTLNGSMCGWLKYFLAPMQDGKFNDGSDIHPIGRAIFVFAGGTKSSYNDFAEQEYKSNDFITAKGPDFLSRLRGYVDIMGVNPANDKDFICLIRRATILRSNIIIRSKTLGTQSHWLLNSKNEISIEAAVLHTLLKIPLYKNGARSMSAIIESCQLSLSKGITKASLPPNHILAMHLDVKRFNELLYAENISGTVFIPAREIMARMVHGYYRKANQGKKNDIPWDDLSVFDQQQNRYQVDKITDLLQPLGFEVELSLNIESSFSTDYIINDLAVAEHKRWMNDKISQGFKYGPDRSIELMTHPNILEWEELTLDDRQKDIDAMKKIPELLNCTGLTIVKK